MHQFSCVFTDTVNHDNNHDREKMDGDVSGFNKGTALTLQEKIRN
jgi:hypothetical protein